MAPSHPRQQTSRSINQRLTDPKKSPNNREKARLNAGKKLNAEGTDRLSGW